MKKNRVFCSRPRRRAGAWTWTPAWWVLCFFLFPPAGRATSATVPTPLRPDLPAMAEGTAWTPGGVYPATHPEALPTDALDSLRTWGSWSGSDANTGRLTLGPFPAPRRFVVAVAGYPGRDGNELFLRRVRDGARRPIAGFEPRESWMEVAVELPADWTGQPVELVGVDAARGPGGWLGVSEPYAAALGHARRVATWPTPGRALPAGRLLGPTAWALALNFLLLPLPGLALLPALRRRVAFPDTLAPLVAFGLSCLCGYAVFWAYFAHPLAGRVASWTAVLGAALALVLALRARRVGRRERPPTTARYAAWGDRETVGAGALTVLVAAFYLGMLFIPGWEHLPIGAIAAQRFSSAGLANDNTLPGLFAEKLSAGEDLLPFLQGDWHSSDRPPLQTGFALLVRPLTLAAGGHPEFLDGTAGMVFQLAWVPALWALLRGTGLDRRATARVIAAVAPTGFLFLNSVYVWPKLGGAALAAGAWCLLVSAEGGGRRPAVRPAALAGGLAALGYLSHGAVVFALLAVGLWLVVAPGRFPGWPAAGAGVGAFVLLNAPWALYGKLYDPPANRLLKWHLAGAVPVDARPTGRTLRESYAAAGVGGTLANKATNVAMIFGGDFRAVPALSAAGAEARRRDDFYYTFRTLGVWNLGWPALVWLGWRHRRRQRQGTGDGRDGFLLATAGVGFLTLTVWAALMFGPRATVIHQGAYLPPLFFLGVLAVALGRAVPPWTFVVVVTWAMVAFAATYGPVPAGSWAAGDADGRDPAATVLALGAGAALWVVAAGPRWSRRAGACVRPGRREKLAR